MTRREFPGKVKDAAYKRASGHCERCTAPLSTGKFRYNHRIPDQLGGDPTLNNCEVLCLACDAPQTYQVDVPAIAKAKRRERAHAGVRKRRSIRGWRKFDGTPVFAKAER
jgi:5-methylcytosine-specific restriction enzyme A